MPASVAYSEEGEDSDFIIDIDALQAHGINVADISKLRSANLHTVAAVHGSMTKNLIKIKGMSETKVEKIKEAVSKCMSDSGGFKTSAELLQQRQRCFRLRTGSKQLDAILNGGFQSSSVSEVFGEYRCGKTQLAHTLCVMAQLKKEDGGCPSGKVAYIDTEGTYRPQRIIEIAHRFNVDPDLASENIIYIRADNSENQHTALLRLAEHFVSGHFRLLIIDSICALFRVDYQGRGELSERQQKLGQHLSVLTRMAEEFNLAVFITNQVQSDPGASALFASADGRKPIGGHVVAHASATRIMLRKGRGLERVAKIVDSPDCPESEATYIITTGGIDDPDKA